MEMISVLLLVNDSGLRSHLRRCLDGNEMLQVVFCSNAKQALELQGSHRHPIVFLDLMPENIDMMDLIEKIKQGVPQPYVLIGSSSCTQHDVLRSMQAGASDFVIDPFDADLIETAFKKAIQSVSSMTASPPSSPKSKQFITQDKPLLRVIEIAKKVAPSTATVLITGESGTGKELLAAFIHANSLRADSPYLAINCAALPEQLAESELFGHEKGAFTGAISKKIGKLEGAGRGTLVLDEITEMALPLQAKLLRAIQEREVVRLGSNRPVPVEARFVAISNRNLKHAVANKVFREDLYFRLSVIPLTIPPLRERKNDIPLLANYFFERFSRINPITMTRISDDTMNYLIDQAWPGNVRELENAIERGVLIGSGNELLPEHLCLESEPEILSHRPCLEVGMTVRDMEKELIYNTLDAVQDNRTHAAKMLGISIRTLRNKLNEYRAEMEGKI